MAVSSSSRRWQGAGWRNGAGHSLSETLVILALVAVAVVGALFLWLDSSAVQHPVRSVVAGEFRSIVHDRPVSSTGGVSSPGPAVSQPNRQR